MTSASVYDILRRILAATLESVQFLSRYPVCRFAKLSEKPNFAQSAFAFPLAGAFIGVLPAILVWLLGLAGLSPQVMALVLLASTILITGALHEDGLADVADGFWGGHTLERKLAIMRDSSFDSVAFESLLIISLIFARFPLFASNKLSYILSVMGVGLGTFALYLMYRSAEIYHASPDQIGDEVMEH